MKPTRRVTASARHLFGSGCSVSGCGGVVDIRPRGYPSGNVWKRQPTIRHEGIHMTDQPTVALLGTGTMGAGMARNIAAAGIPLTVWNRTRAKAEPLSEHGITVADTAADAVREADIVLTMLYDADSVVSALEEARDGLRSGAVLLQQSTVGVAGAQRLGETAEELGLVYVDAPVLGTKKPAEDGALVVLASGPGD